MALTINLTDVVGSSGDIGYIPYIVANDKLGNSVLRQSGTKIVNSGTYQSPNGNSLLSILNGSSTLQYVDAIGNPFVYLDNTELGGGYNDVLNSTYVYFHYNNSGVTNETNLPAGIYAINFPSVQKNGVELATLNDISGYEPAFTKNTAFNRNFGVSSGDILLQVGTTASRVLVTDSNNQVASSSITGTQLGYLGTTSGDIQSQINTINATPKHISSTFYGSLTNSSPADSTTSYIGQVLVGTPNATATNRQFKLRTGVLRSGRLGLSVNTILGTNEAITVNLRNITDSTSTLLGTITADAVNGCTLLSGLSIATNSSKAYSLEWVFPAFATNPTNVQYTTELNIFDI